jgi:hypothetical protein
MVAPQQRVALPRVTSAHLPQPGASPSAGSALGDRRALPRARPKAHLVSPLSFSAVFVPQLLPLCPPALATHARGRRSDRGRHGRRGSRRVSRRDTSGRRGRQTERDQPIRRCPLGKPPRRAQLGRHFQAGGAVPAGGRGDGPTASAPPPARARSACAQAGPPPAGRQPAPGQASAPSRGPAPCATASGHAGQARRALPHL